MKFINNNKPIKIRLESTSSMSGYTWKTIRNGDIIDLLEERGVKYGLDPVSNEKIENDDEQQPNKHKAEDKLNQKKKDNELYKEKIEAINGIGEKTARDLIQVYPTEKQLIKALGNGNDVPIRDDLAKKIKKAFKVK